MNDDKAAKDYNIEGGSVLHLVSSNPALLRSGLLAFAYYFLCSGEGVLYKIDKCWKLSTQQQM